MRRKKEEQKANFFREALRRYIQEKKWQELQEYGARQAKRLGIKEAEVEGVIGEYQKERK